MCEIQFGYAQIQDVKEGPPRGSPDQLLLDSVTFPIVFTESDQLFEAVLLRLPV